MERTQEAEKEEGGRRCVLADASAHHGRHRARSSSNQQLSAQSQAQQEGQLVSPLGSSCVSGEVLNLTPWLHRSQTIQGPW